jgi:Protein of unknown function (DUF5661)
LSKGLAGVKTLTANEIAKKWKLPLAVVAKKIAAGVKVEKEHTTSTRQANEIARDHLGERPDYYDKLHKMEKTKVVKEETTTTGVGGLGFRSGTPAIDADNEYTNTNALSYFDENGNKLDYINRAHNDYHNSRLGFHAFDPTRIGANKNFYKHHKHDLKEAKHPLQANFDKYRQGKLNELGEYDNKGGSPGYEETTGPIRAVRKRDVKEQSPANPSYKERPLYERGKVPADMSGAAERGVYEMDTSRMPLSKNIEDIRSTTGKDWKSRVMTAAAHVGGAIGDIKNAISGPPKPDMTRLSPKDSLPAERPAWSPDGGTSTPQIKNYKNEYEPKFNASQVTSLTPRSRGSQTSTRILDTDPKYQGKTPSSTSGSTTQAATMERPGSQTKETDYYTPPGGSIFAKNMKEARGIYEVSAEKVGQVHLRYLEKNKPVPDFVRRAVVKKWLESKVGKIPEKEKSEKKEPKPVKEEDNTKPDVNLMGNQKPDAYGYGAKGTTKTIHEETKMDNKELINEALDCILEDNLPEMKDNLMLALQEKAMEKLEERKKEIAANYFAQ